MDVVRKEESGYPVKQTTDNEVSSTKKPGDSGSRSWSPFKDIRVFVAVMACIRIVYYANVTSAMAALTTLGKRYSLTATQQGFLVSAGSIGTVCTMSFTSYFFGKPSNHRPRWIFFGLILSCTASTMLILPHFLSQPYEYHKAGNFSAGTGGSLRGLCTSNETKDCGGSGDDTKQQVDNTMAYRLLIAGRVMDGIAIGFLTPLSYSYTDDFSGKRSSVYLGILDDVSGIGAPLGFGLMAPAVLTIYVDFNRVDMSDINIDDTDPRWVGAWWLNAAILMPITFLLSIPLLFFPKFLLSGSSDNTDIEKKNTQPKGRTRAKGGQSMDSQCTTCDCSLDHYQPVCGSDGLNYYSPCYAGCKTAVNEKNFTDCQCISSESATSNFAYDGLCPIPRCKYFVLFLLILTIFAIANSAISLPSTIIAIRSVEQHRKSFALGVRSVIIELFSFVTPLIAGQLIDSTCILWRQESGIRTGTCAQYDNFMYRVLFMSVSAGFSCVAFCILVLLLCILKFRQSKSAQDFSSSPNGMTGDDLTVQLKSIEKTEMVNPVYEPE
ncbi:solute carrier organic anion transporter family member 2A1-like [Glandiceps talaboti]